MNCTKRDWSKLSAPECGVQLSNKNLPLLESFRFEKIVDSLRPSQTQ